MTDEPGRDDDTPTRPSDPDPASPPKYDHRVGGKLALAALVLMVVYMGLLFVIS